MNDTDCLFCKIVSGEISGDILHRDEKVVAFKDVNPQAPQHIIIVPTNHIASVEMFGEDDKETVFRMIDVANKLAQDGGFGEAGYRLVINKGLFGGQSVDHVHLHLLGGRRLSWPPG